MTIKKLLLILLVLFILTVVSIYLYLLPYIALWKMEKAIAKQDSQQLATYIDYAQLKQNDDIDLYTPDKIIKLMAQDKKSRYQFAYSSARYQSINDFVVYFISTRPAKEKTKLSVYLTRQGLDWRVVDIDISHYTGLDEIEQSEMSYLDRHIRENTLQRPTSMEQPASIEQAVAQAEQAARTALIEDSENNAINESTHTANRQSNEAGNNSITLNNQTQDRQQLPKNTIIDAETSDTSSNYQDSRVAPVIQENNPAER